MNWKVNDRKIPLMKMLLNNDTNIISEDKSIRFSFLFYQFNFDSEFNENTFK